MAHRDSNRNEAGPRPALPRSTGVFDSTQRALWQPAHPPGTPGRGRVRTGGASHSSCAGRPCAQKRRTAIARGGMHALYADLPNRLLERRTRDRDRVWVADVTYLKVGRALAIPGRGARQVVATPDRLVHSVPGATSRSLCVRSVARCSDAGLILASSSTPTAASSTPRYAFRDRLQTLGFVQSMNRPQRMKQTTRTWSHSSTR